VSSTDLRAPIVVGIDGSDSARKAMEWAADEAQNRQVPLVMVHARYAGPRFALTPGTATTIEAEATGYGAELLEQAIAVLTVRNPTLTVRSELVAERPAQALIDASRGAGLVVVGRGSEGRVGAFLLGSIASRVVAHADSPTVVVREPADPADFKIVVGVSTSSGGWAAMRFACEEAQVRSGQVLGIRCWSDAGFGLAGIGYMVTASLERWEAAEQQLLEDWLARARAEYPDVVIKGRLSNLPLDSAIEETSRRAAMVVLGTRTAEAGSTKLGPAASWAISHAHCPVVVTGHPARTPARTDEIGADISGDAGARTAPARAATPDIAEQPNDVSARTVNVELNDADLRLIHNALASFMTDFGHDESEVIDAIRAVLAKLPPSSNTARLTATTLS
jgi:nucleotide-binding universal stress UspA family protein